MADKTLSSTAANGEGPRQGWRTVLPPAQWLAAYWPQWLRGDAVAGVSLAAYVIPEPLAYASLAGVPPQNGIYCYLLGGLCYTMISSFFMMGYVCSLFIGNRRIACVLVQEQQQDAGPDHGFRFRGVDIRSGFRTGS
jgi:hypothetical protein